MVGGEVLPQVSGEAEARSRSKCMARALRLLTMRARTEEELKDRLLRLGFADSVVASVLARLKELGYLNDMQFARDWALERIELKGYGRALIRFELIKKGIKPSLVDEVLEEVFSTVDEFELARHVATGRSKAYRGLDPETARRRLISYLARRGFEFPTIEKVTDEIFSSLLDTDSGNK